MAVVAVFLLSYAREFPSITTVVIRQLALRNSVTYLLPISTKSWQNTRAQRALWTQSGC